MTAKPVSPLRQRMINDMNVRNFVPDTQREYIRAVNPDNFMTRPSFHLRAVHARHLPLLI